jgi:hypothetical protein
MRRFLITTIRRHTPHTEPSGYIYLVDAEQRKVLQRSVMIEPAYREVDTNPRGGMRGSRGISVAPDRIAIANASIVYLYSPTWDLQGIISHPSAAAIHDIHFQGETLWVTAARNDLLLQFDLSGRLLSHFYMRQPSLATKTLKWQPRILFTPESVRQGSIDFRDPRTHDEETYDHAHVNSICFLSNGEMLVSLGLVLGTGFSALLRIKARLVRAGIWPRLLAANRRLRSWLRLKKNMHSDLVVQPARARSAVFRFSPDGQHRLALALNGVTVPSHSLLALPDETVIYLNTTAGSVVRFSPDTGQVLSDTRVTDGFLRGVTQVSGNRLLMGSKNELITFDLRDLKVDDVYKFISDPNESVYDIKELPEHFGAPPLSFEDHFYQSTGVRSQDLPANDYKIRLPKQP